MSPQHSISLAATATLVASLAIAPSATATAQQPPEEKQMAKTEPPPIACNLNSQELQERKAMVEAELLPRVLETTELPKGYVFWFPSSEGELARIAEFVELESRCCPFLDFEVRLAAGSDRISLRLEGPDGAKELLKAFVDR